MSAGISARNESDHVAGQVQEREAVISARNESGSRIAHRRRHRHGHRPINHSAPPLGRARAALAAVAAAVYGIARIAGAIPRSVPVARQPTGDGPLTLGSVVVASVIAVLVATALYAAVRRMTGRPNRGLWVVGVVGLVISLAFPFSIPDVPLEMALTLVLLMHVMTAATALVTLTRTLPNS